MDEENVVVSETATTTDDADRVTRAERRTQVRTLCRSLGLSSTFADTAIDEELTDPELHARAIGELQRRTPATIRTAHNATTLDNPQAYRRAASDALHGFMVETQPQGGAARDLHSRGWAGFHADVYRRAGHSTAGLSDAEIITRAASMSDYPMLMDAATQRIIGDAYTAAQSPVREIFGRTTVPDFNVRKIAWADWTAMAVGRVNELGEFKTTYMAELGTSVSALTLGGIAAVSKQAYVTGGPAVAAIPQKLTRTLAADVDKRRVDFLVQASLAGPTLSDGTALFHADRGNIEGLDTTSTETTIDSALAARAKMPLRTTPTGSVPIGSFPSWWVVPVGFEAQAMRALANVSPATAGDFNPLSGKLQVIAEPRLADTDTSYLAARPTEVDGLTEVRLAGAGGPEVTTRWGFEVDAFQARIRLDIGFAALGWLGLTRLDHGAS